MIILAIACYNIIFVMMRKMIEIGQIYASSNCGDFEVIDYVNGHDITVRFIKTGTVKKTYHDAVMRGAIKDVLYPSVYGVGFIGEGTHKPTDGKSGTKSYMNWRSMMQRCYCPKFARNNKAYSNCSVDPVWHNFQNFADWHNENYFDGYELDKDFLLKGNTIYGPATCLYIPKWLNLFITRSAKKSEHIPGVCFNKNAKKYQGRASKAEGGNIHLGYFSELRDAEHAVLNAKANYLIERSLAESLPSKLIASISSLADSIRSGEYYEVPA